MNTLLLSVVLVTVSSSIVFAKSQTNCSTSDECEKDGCCFNRTCSYKSSCKCIHQNCSSNSNCSLPTESCCVNKKCQACTNGSEASDGGRSRSDSLSGATIVLLILIPINVTICMCCAVKVGNLRDEAQRKKSLRSEMILRQTCNTSVALVVNDELQNEHELAHTCPSIIIIVDNSNMDLIRGAQRTGDTEKVKCVPHDHFSLSVNFPPNTTEQNSTQKELMQFQPLQNTAF